MKTLAKLALIGLFATMPSCTADSSKLRPDNSSAASAGTCTVSFELTYSDKPAANKTLAIFSLAGDTIKTSKEYVLGKGKTDAAGKGTIPFNCRSKATYVILEEVEPEAMMSLRHENGSFLSFECGGDKHTCNLGKLNAALFGH